MRRTCSSASVTPLPFVHVRHALAMAAAPAGHQYAACIPSGRAMRKMHDRDVAAVVLDANNIRGESTSDCQRKARVSSFELGLAARLDRPHRSLLGPWSTAEAHTLEGVTHAWAGPKRSADDLIACDVVPELYRQMDGDGCVYVVTTDRELISRVKHAASMSGAAHGRLGSWARGSTYLLLHALDGNEALEGDASTATEAGLFIACGRRRCHGTCRV